MNIYRQKTISDIISGHSYYYFLFFLLILGAVWIAKPLNEYLIGDATMFILFTQKALGYINTSVIDISSGQSVWHPLLYNFTMLAVAKIFGLDLIWQRAIGIVCLAFSFFLLIKICDLFSPNPSEKRSILFLTCAFFILIPYGLTGSVHIDIDNTVMSPVLLLFIYCFCKFIKEDHQARNIYFVFSCLSMALALWAKLTTPLLFPPAIFLFYLIKKRPKEAFLIPICITALSGGIFLITWYLYCWFADLPFGQVIQRTFNVFVGKGVESINENNLTFIRDIALLGFWFNPVLLFVWLVISFEVIKENLKQKNSNDIPLFITIFTLLLFFGYLLIARIIFTVPKYFFSATIFISFLLAIRISPYVLKLEIKKVLCVFSFILMLAIFYYYIGDPIYLLTYQLKILAIHKLPFTPVIRKLVWGFFFYLMPLVVSLCFFGMKQPEKAKAILLISIIAQTSGLKFRQTFSDYRIGYAYGYTGEAQTYENLPDNGMILYPEGAIVPPTGKIKGTGILNFISYPIQEWDDIVGREKPAAIVTGPAVLPLSNIAYFSENPEWKKSVLKDYTVTEYGDYSIYTRRKE